MVEIGDFIVKWPNTKIFIVTDIFEGFCQAKLFISSNEERRFHKVMNEKKIFELHPAELFKVTFKPNKFKIGDKIFYRDSRHNDRTIEGEITGFTAETTGFPGSGDTEVEVKYHYFIKVGDDPESYFSKSTFIAESNIYKVINTNTLWNDVCSSTK